MHMYKYLPQFELSPNPMFKNIVNFKLFGICLLVYIACIRTSPIGDQHWWQLVRLVSMATEPLKYTILIGTNGDQRLIADGHHW